MTLVPDTNTSVVSDAATRFDSFLGNPRDRDAVITFERSVEQDEAAEFPQTEFDALVSSGLQDLYVPRQYGGALSDLYASMLAVRAVARRDLTAAVAHGKTFLGGVCAWVAPSEVASDVVAPIILGGECVSWGLTERGHGSDLLAGTTTARPHNNGSWTLDGEKWLINNATRGRAMTVLARTGAEPGPRSLSLIFVDKNEIDAGLSACDKVATHGIRGADISGLGFTSVVIPQGRLIGEPGQGLEIVLKGLQATRTLCTALSLGAGDNVVSAAVEFADHRRLYGKRLADLGAAQETLATAATTLAIAETLSFVGARHLQVRPEECAVVSPVIKYFVPHLIDRILVDLTRFVGAHSTLIDSPFAHVQKAVRDNRVVGIFDGNSIVNLNAIINEFPSIVRRSADNSAQEPLQLSQAACTQSFNPEGLRLRTRQGATLLRDFSSSIDATSLSGPARILARTLADRFDTLLHEVAAFSPQRHPAPDLFRAAHEYAVLFAVASVVACAGSETSDLGFWRVPGRLERALQLLSRQLDPTRLAGGWPGLSAEAVDAASDLVCAARRAAEKTGAVGAFNGRDDARRKED